MPATFVHGSTNVKIALTVSEEPTASETHLEILQVQSKIVDVGVSVGRLCQGPCGSKWGYECNCNADADALRNTHKDVR